MTESHIKPVNPYRAVFDQSTDALLIIQGDTQSILEVNARVQTMLGYIPGELIGKPFSILSASDDSAGRTPLKVFDGVFTDVFRRKDGSAVSLDLTASTVPWPPDGSILIALRDATERIAAELERERLVKELETALENVKTLRGLLPICAHCKKVRNDDGYWQQVESYVSERSLAEFTHGICPECIKKHYADLYDIEDENPKEST